MNLNSKVELMLIPALAEMNLVFLDETPIFILDFFEVNENLKYCWIHCFVQWVSTSCCKIIPVSE